MKKLFKLSRFTYVHELANGDILMHNSFMGALAKIPFNKRSEVDPLLTRNSHVELDENNDLLIELCSGGFYVSVENDEICQLDDVLAYERDGYSLNLIILPHEQCNFRCRYCYETFEHGKMPPHVVTAIKKYIQEKLPSYKQLKIYWFGGEPLLASDVITELSEFSLDFCKKHDKKYAASITTNGYLLTPSTASQLLSCGITNYQITLDGPESIHDRNRKLADGGGTYSRIFQNLLLLKNQAVDFHVVIRVNFDPHLLQQLSEWIDTTITPAFADDHRFSVNFNLIENWSSSMLFDNACATAFPLKLNLIENTEHFQLTKNYVKDCLMPNSNVCYAAKKSSLIIGSNGTLYKCSIAFKDECNHVGYVDQSGTIIIDEIKLNKWINTSHLDCSRCSTCSFYPSCQSRKCPKAGLETGKPKCPFSTDDYLRLLELASLT